MIRFYINYTPGSGGHFLRHFLEPTIKLTKANFWVDEEYHSFAGGGKGNFNANPYPKESCFKFGNRYPEIFTIGLGPINSVEFIKVNTLKNIKNMHRSISDMDYIITDIQFKTMNFFDRSQVDFMINYENLFNINVLKKLYTDLHNTPVPEHKISYYENYKHQHDKIFSSWNYKVIEKICLFEYNNNVIECFTGIIRKWSIDDIKQNNWQEYLEENLCLTNYR